MNEYKSVHRDLVDKRLEIDCTMSVAGTLISKEGSPSSILNGRKANINFNIHCKYRFYKRCEKSVNFRSSH